MEYFSHCYIRRNLTASEKYQKIGNIIVPIVQKYTQTDILVSWEQQNRFELVLEPQYKRVVGMVGKKVGTRRLHEVLCILP